MAVANNNQSNPIAFIAVSSGQSHSDVARYLKKNNVNWPTIVDVDRSFEKSAGVNEISLQNIWSSRVIDPDGNFRSVGKFESAVEEMAKEASWNVDPTGIPASMKEAWLAIEFGNYSVAAKSVTRALKNKKPDVNEAAVKLHDFVQQDLAKQLEIASTARTGNKPWLAFKTYSEIETRFDGYEIEMESDLETVLDELKNDPAVVDEVAAAKQLNGIMKQIAKSGVSKVSGRLKKLVDKYPATEASATAEKMLANIE